MMWTAVTAWFWWYWKRFLAGPPVWPIAMTETAVEIAIERACRRVLQAHEARLYTMKDHNLVTVCFMDSDEKGEHGQQVLQAWQRLPSLTLGTHSYRLARYDPQRQMWIYRQVTS